MLVIELVYRKMSTKKLTTLFLRKTTNTFNKFSIFKQNSYFFKSTKINQIKNILQKNEHQQNKKLFSYDNIKIDPKSENLLQQYENKMKQIKDEHQKIDSEIKLKYDQIFKILQFSSDEQIQQAKQKKIDEMLKNREMMNKKLISLTNQFKPKFISERKSFQLQYLKNYMLQNVSHLKEQHKSTSTNSILQQLLNENKQNNFIPNGLVLKKLTFKTSDNKTKQVLLAGIQENQEQHCIYLKQLIEKFKIKDVLTLLPPDLPIFIKSQKSFLQEWTQFLKTPSPSFKFYLNPNPKVLKDIRITRQYIPLVVNSMVKSKSFYQTVYSLMRLNQVKFKYEHQPILSGLKSNTVENVYFCDYPFLKEREMIALNVKLDDLRQLMKQYTYFKVNKKQHFSAELLLPKNVVEKKFKHIIKLAKTICVANQKTPILICKADIAQLLAEQWKQSPMQFLQFDYNQNEYFLDLDLNKRGQDQNQTLFIEFIQKLVILDLIISPLIQNYFVKYESFPYSCRNTVGGKENLQKVFILWNHYYTLYKKAIQGASPSRKSFAQ